MTWRPGCPGTEGGDREDTCAEIFKQKTKDARMTAEFFNWVFR